MSSSIYFVQGKAPKEIHAILTETLACFLPGRAKDFSALRVVYLLLELFLHYKISLKDVTLLTS